MLTANRLRKVLSYAPATGIFRWKVSASTRAPVGTIAGAKNGRVTVKFALMVGLIQQVALLGSM
jgi:hypothetical protein